MRTTKQDHIHVQGKQPRQFYWLMVQILPFLRYFTSWSLSAYATKSAQTDHATLCHTGGHPTHTHTHTHTHREREREGGKGGEERELAATELAVSSTIDLAASTQIVPESSA